MRFAFLLALAVLLSGCSSPDFAPAPTPNDPAEGSAEGSADGPEEDPSPFAPEYRERLVDYQGPPRTDHVLNASSAVPTFAVEPPCAEPVDLEPVAGVVSVLDADPTVATQAVEAVFGLAVTDVQETHQEQGLKDAVYWTQRTWNATVEGGSVEAFRHETESLTWGPTLVLEVQADWVRDVDRALVEQWLDALDVGGAGMEWSDSHYAERLDWRVRERYQGLYTGAHLSVSVDGEDASLRVVVHSLLRFPSEPPAVSPEEAEATAKAYMTCLDLPWDEYESGIFPPTALVRDNRVVYGVQYPNSSCLDERRVLVDVHTGDVLGVDVAQSCVT